MPLCPYIPIKKCHTFGFASIPQIIWMKLPGKHEVRADRTKTVNEEFPCPFCKWMVELGTWMQALPWRATRGDIQLPFWNNKECFCDKYPEMLRPENNSWNYFFFQGNFGFWIIGWHQQLSAELSWTKNFLQKNKPVILWCRFLGPSALFCSVSAPLWPYLEQSSDLIVELKTPYYYKPEEQMSLFDLHHMMTKPWTRLDSLIYK